MTNTQVKILDFRQRQLAQLRADLVELGREAWRITERERAVRSQIDLLLELGDE
jgi:hypothetical protein